MQDKIQKKSVNNFTLNNTQEEIFVSNETHREIVKRFINILSSKGLEIVTKIQEIKPFYRAEEYHQGYYKKKVLNHITILMLKDFRVLLY